MFTMIAAVALVHGVALAAVLLATRYDSQLVDEDGRPSFVTADVWQETVVPAIADRQPIA